VPVGAVPGEPPGRSYPERSESANDTALQVHDLRPIVRGQALASGLYLMRCGVSASAPSRSWRCFS
jgi:hypothetical protein